MDVETLVSHLFKNGLIIKDDFECVNQLSNMTRCDKVNFLLAKLLHLRREGYEVFINCLKDANEHRELYHKLSTYN